ncbi:MAG: hypothetical protein K9K65_10060 [Desulfarculaceae bacterium]|nr:hypothetical protein [Desulfarculaceae bacterium]MCF8098174.1 hypothetical protein [Desulfarculaceae bacterium]MCF8121970.1 hypothetical protein [Desulfarculaceae bacterium]
MKRRFKAGMLAGLLILVILMGQSFISSWLSPTLAEQYNNTALYRPWSVPVMWLIFLYPFLLGLALAWIWDKVKGLLGSNFLTSAVKFAFAYWAAGVIPTMVMIYSCFPVTKWVILIWTVSGFFYGLVSALVFARMLPRD